jgi:hypothetical protein
MFNNVGGPHRIAPGPPRAETDAPKSGVHPSSRAVVRELSSGSDQPRITAQKAIRENPRTSAFADALDSPSRRRRRSSLGESSSSSSGDDLSSSSSGAEWTLSDLDADKFLKPDPIRSAAVARLSTPEIPYETRMRPALVQAFGGAYEVHSLTPEATGSPENPHAVWVSDRETARQILRRAADDPCDPNRVAWITTRHGATDESFVLSHSYAVCQPVVAFWKDRNGAQFATLFHFNGTAPEDDLAARLDVIKARHGDGEMVIDSVCNFHGRPSRPELELSFEVTLAALAGKRNFPLRSIECAPTTHLAVAVDVRNGTIAMIEDKNLNHGLPSPTRD